MEEVTQGYQSLSYSKWDCKYHWRGYPATIPGENDSPIFSPDDMMQRMGSSIRRMLFLTSS